MELNYDLNMTGLERQWHPRDNFYPIKINSSSQRKKSFDRWPVDKNGVTGAWIELTYIIKA